MRELDAALGVAELTVHMRKVREALTEAIDGEIGAGAGDGGAEARYGDVLEDFLHGVDEVDVETLGVGGIAFAADGAENRRRSGVVGGGDGEVEEEEEEEEEGSHSVEEEEWRILDLFGVWMSCSYRHLEKRGGCKVRKEEMLKYKTILFFIFIFFFKLMLVGPT